MKIEIVIKTNKLYSWANIIEQLLPIRNMSEITKSMIIVMISEHAQETL